MVRGRRALALTVFWGSWYGHFGAAFPQFTGNPRFYAFSLGGK